MRLTVVQLTIGALAHFLSGQNLPKAEPWSTKVQLDVSADTQALQEQITSYIGRELRFLQDVTVVDEDSDYRVLVNAMRLLKKGDRADGIAIAVVVEGRFRWEIFAPILATLSKENRKVLEDFNSLEMLLDFNLMSGAPDDVPDLCRRAVTNMDARVFEPMRRGSRQFIETLRKRDAVR